MPRSRSGPSRPVALIYSALAQNHGDMHYQLHSQYICQSFQIIALRSFSRASKAGGRMINTIKYADVLVVLPKIRIVKVNTTRKKHPEIQGDNDIETRSAGR